MAHDRYVQPGWFTRNVFNRMVVASTRRGLSIWGSRILEVRGRSSGQLRQTPVNLLTFGEDRYLVAQRGEIADSAKVNGVGADADEAELERIAPNHPVFRVEMTPT